MIERPIIVLGAPRSGTTIVQRCLIVHPDVWHLAGESHEVLEGPFHPSYCGYESNRVLAEEVDERVVSAILRKFYHKAINLNPIWSDPTPVMGAGGLKGRIAYRIATKVVGGLSQLRKPTVLRLCEKTPKNTLRVPLMERLFPDALYVWIERSVVDNVASLAAGWRADERIGRVSVRRFSRAGYPIADTLSLRGYSEKWWKFALVPGWRELKECSIEEVAAWQYYQCNLHAMRDLLRVPPERVFPIRFEDFVERPVQHVRAICDWAGLASSSLVQAFSERLPRVNSVGSHDAAKLRRGNRPDPALVQALQGLPTLSELEFLSSQLRHRAALLALAI